MQVPTAHPASITRPNPQTLVFSGDWTVRGLGAITHRMEAADVSTSSATVADGEHIEAMDTAGAWVLQKLVRRLSEGETRVTTMRGLRPAFQKLLDAAAEQAADPLTQPKPTGTPRQTLPERVGRSAAAASAEAMGLLSFVGESALAFCHCAAHPTHWRVRPTLFNIRSAGIDALPIVGLLSFLLGVVVAYQGADQLRQYGANIFVTDLVGVSMLREFAPLITAIIVAGRSGSAYAAQIGTMSVTEEIDAMRTLGIAPMELLVLPKIIALMIALPLLTVFADVLGVFGGMIMARAQLDVGFGEFTDRFVKAVGLTTYLTGLFKAPVFAAIIAVVGCYQGFRTRSGADSVGRQTTRSVVQSIFLVIVADALFSIIFSTLDL